MTSNEMVHLQPLNMPRRSKKSSHTKHSQRRAEQQAKDQKARYERCRRRRWGLVKKAREYSHLFGAEVYLLMRDQHNAQYYTSEGGWISTPQDVVSQMHFGW